MDAADGFAIHQLLNHYGHVVDAQAWDRFDELFTADCVLDYTAVRAPRVFHGIAEIRSYFEAANHPSAHHVTNIVVSERDGEVRVKSKFLVPFTRDTHVPIRWYGGDYDDAVVTTGDGWRFSRRVCTPRWQMTAEQGPLPDGRTTF